MRVDSKKTRTSSGEIMSSSGTAPLKPKDGLSGPPAYDVIGNTTNDGYHNYFYDAENRLIQVDGTLGTCSSATACYVYDAMARRVRHVVPAGAQEYIQDLQGKVVVDYTYSSSYTGPGTEY